MSFNNMTVRTRVRLVFGLMLALVLGLAGVARWGLSQLADTVGELSQQRLPNVVDASDWEGQSLQSLRAMRNALLADNAAAVGSELAHLGELQKERTLDRERLAARQLSEQDRVRFKQLADLDDAYRVLEASFSSQAAPKDLAGAKRLLADQIVPLQLRYGQALHGFVNLQVQQAEAARAHAQQVQDFVGHLSLGIMVLAVLLGGVAFSWLRRSLMQSLGAEPAELMRTARRVATGDLSHPVQALNGDHSSLMAALQDLQSHLASLVSKVRHNAQSLAQDSARMVQSSNELTSRTAQQASALQETANSAQELGSTVRQNADNARQANQLAMNASDLALQGGEVVAQVVDTMKGINDSSRKIADIIGVIDGIAFQTNILALNAAVEAARAGEQGRGFAVVASEVRNLAQRSAAAAREIKSLISASVERVELGSHLVDKAGSTMDEVVAAIKRVTDIMGEIAAASTEQNLSVKRVAESVAQIDQATQQNAVLAQASTAAASALEARATDLVQGVSVFQLSAAAADGAAAKAVAAQAPKQVTPQVTPGRANTAVQAAAAGAIPHAAARAEWQRKSQVIRADFAAAGPAAARRVPSVIRKPAASPPQRLSRPLPMRPISQAATTRDTATQADAATATATSMPTNRIKPMPPAPVRPKPFSKVQVVAYAKTGTDDWETF